MPKSKKAQEKENSLLPASEQLRRLHEPENNGRGVSCVRSICQDLQRGDIEGAKLLASHDWDKIANYPKIARWLMDNNLADKNNYVNE